MVTTGNWQSIVSDVDNSIDKKIRSRNLCHCRHKKRQQSTSPTIQARNTPLTTFIIVRRSARFLVDDQIALRDPILCQKTKRREIFKTSIHFKQQIITSRQRSPHKKSRDKRTCGSGVAHNKRRYIVNNRNKSKTHHESITADKRTL